MLLLFAGTGLALHAADPDPDPAPPPMGNWSLSNWIPGEGVQLRLFYRKGSSRSEWSSTQPLADLQGLTPSQLHAIHTTVAFSLRRDAGSFACEGTLTLGAGHGQFRFTPDPSYAAKLEALGYEPIGVDAYPLMMLAWRDVSVAYASDAKKAGLRVAETSDLVHLLDHGVDLDFIRALGAAGYAGLTADDVTNLRDHGIDGDYLRGLKASGASDWSVLEIVKLHDHGVDPDYVARIHSAGYGDLTVDQIIRLHDHGVDPDYVARIHAAGYGDLTVDQIIRLHDHGVD
jgi:hypothetical protein